jgi:hypothetical protein
VAGGALARHFPRRHRSLANPSASLTPYVGRNFTDDAVGAAEAFWLALTAALVAWGVSPGALHRAV